MRALRIHRGSRLLFPSRQWDGHWHSHTWAKSARSISAEGGPAERHRRNAVIPAASKGTVQRERGPEALAVFARPSGQSQLGQRPGWTDFPVYSVYSAYSSPVAWLRISTPESCRSGPTPTSHAHRSSTSLSQELPCCRIQVRGRVASLWRLNNAMGCGTQGSKPQKSPPQHAARRCRSSAGLPVHRKGHVSDGPLQTRPLGVPTALSAAGFLGDATPWRILQLALCSSGASRVKALRTARG